MTKFAQHHPVAFAALLIAALALPAGACLVCVADPMERIVVTELQRSADVVLARPATDGSVGKFEIVKVMRSAAGIKRGTWVSASLPFFSEDGWKMGAGKQLLTRREAKSPWIIRAPASLLTQQVFFQRVLSIPVKEPGVDKNHDASRAHFFLSYLHHADPLLDRAAAAEIATAPYAALLALKKKLDPTKIRAELKDPAAGERRQLYYTLLGICGNEQDAASLNKRLDSMWKSNGAKNLAAMLTAKLELEGEGAVAQIAARYFRDRSRTLPEIEAAILALRVHGNSGAAISRQQVIEAYRSLFDDREPLVFLIAGDLARWEDWESKDRLVAIAQRRGDALPEIRRQVQEYLKACPR